MVVVNLVPLFVGFEGLPSYPIEELTLAGGLCTEGEHAKHQIVLLQSLHLSESSMFIFALLFVTIGVQ